MTNLEDLENEAIEFIKEHVSEEPFVLYFSGGKDSCIVRHMLQRAGVRYIGVYKITTIEPEYVIEFIRRREDISLLSPKKNFMELIKENIFLPVKGNCYCCTNIRGGWDDHPNKIKISGVTNEPWRSNRKKVNCVDGKLYHLSPIVDWTEDKRWEYIKKYSIPNLSYTYGGISQNCALCPVHSKEIDSDNYDEKMTAKKIEYPAQYQIMRDISDYSFNILTTKGYTILASNKDEYFKKWFCKEKLIAGVESIVEKP